MCSHAAKVQQQIMGQGPILNRLEIATAVLKEMNLLQEQIIHPDKVLCHPANRGGAKVHSIGVDVKQLDTYLCELPPAGKVRAKHINFNEEQVKIGEDMLAPVSGHELYTSVSGGHFMAFCKAANAGCKTCLLYTSPSPRDGLLSRMPSSA